MYLYILITSISSETQGLTLYYIVFGALQTAVNGSSPFFQMLDILSYPWILPDPSH
jgi:hypothetical protein